MADARPHHEMPEDTPQDDPRDNEDEVALHIAPPSPARAASGSASSARSLDAASRRSLQQRQDDAAAAEAEEDELPPLQSDAHTEPADMELLAAQARAEQDLQAKISLARSGVSLRSLSIGSESLASPGNSNGGAGKSPGGPEQAAAAAAAAADASDGKPADGRAGGGMDGAGAAAAAAGAHGAAGETSPEPTLAAALQRPPDDDDSSDSESDSDDSDSDSDASNSGECCPRRLQCLSRVRWLHERQALTAACALGLVIFAIGLYFEAATDEVSTARALLLVGFWLIMGLFSAFTVTLFDVAVGYVFVRSRADRVRELCSTMLVHVSETRGVFERAAWSLWTIIGTTIIIPQGLNERWDLAHFHLLRVLAILLMVEVAQIATVFLRMRLSADFNTRTLKHRYSKSMANEHFLCTLNQRTYNPLFLSLYAYLRKMASDSRADLRVWQDLMRYVSGHQVDGSELSKSKLRARGSIGFVESNASVSKHSAFNKHFAKRMFARLFDLCDSRRRLRLGIFLRPEPPASARARMSSAQRQAWQAGEVGGDLSAQQLQHAQSQAPRSADADGGTSFGSRLQAGGTATANLISSFWQSRNTGNANGTSGGSMGGGAAASAAASAAGGTAPRVRMATTDGVMSRRRGPGGRAQALVRQQASDDSDGGARSARLAALDLASSGRAGASKARSDTADDIVLPQRKRANSGELTSSGGLGGAERPTGALRTLTGGDSAKLAKAARSASTGSGGSADTMTSAGSASVSQAQAAAQAQTLPTASAQPLPGAPLQSRRASSNPGGDLLRVFRRGGTAGAPERSASPQPVPAPRAPLQSRAQSQRQTLLRAQSSQAALLDGPRGGNGNTLGSISTSDSRSRFGSRVEKLRVYKEDFLHVVHALSADDSEDERVAAANSAAAAASSSGPGPAAPVPAGARVGSDVSASKKPSAALGGAAASALASVSTKKLSDPERIWTEVLDPAGTGYVSSSRFTRTVLSMFDDRRNIGVTLQDSRRVIKSIDYFTFSFALILVFFVALATYNINFLEVWLALSSAILGFSFIFGDTVRVAFTNVLFLFVQHPYDVGDHIAYPPSYDRYVVRRINLYSTEMVRWDGQLTRVDNSFLNNLAGLMNLSTSDPRGVNLSLLVDCECVSAQFLDRVLAEVRAYVTSKPDVFTGSASGGARELADPFKVRIAFYAELSAPLAADVGKSNRDVSDLMLVIIDALRRHGARYTRAYDRADAAPYPPAEAPYALPAYFNLEEAQQQQAAAAAAQQQKREEKEAAAFAAKATDVSMRRRFKNGRRDD